MSSARHEESLEASRQWADYLHERAGELFDSATVAAADDAVHDEYLETQDRYEAHMRDQGATVTRWLWQEARDYEDFADAWGDSDRQEIDRRWDRFIDWRVRHGEELRLNASQGL